MSDHLVSELDSTSDNYNEAHVTFLEQRIRAIYALAPKAKAQGDLGMLMAETYVDPWLYRQLNLARLIKTDPFLPRSIRVKTADMYDDRVEKMTSVYCRIMEEYCRDLYAGNVEIDIDQVDRRIRSAIGKDYCNLKWGWEDAEKKIVQLRVDIEEYLNQLP